MEDINELLIIGKFIQELYNELIKLKELLDKNIITKKEFEKEKKRILDSFDHETEKISEKNIEQYEENGLVPKNRE